MPLHVREWTRGVCGTVHALGHGTSRDVLFEGARIVASGRAETSNACEAPAGPAYVPARRGGAGSRRPGLTAEPSAHPIGDDAERYPGSVRWGGGEP
ncbi:hypothetical protein ADK41_32450 [Streptomyces caelestis]|uniref:Uncharacterized protein n=1 Tax=Streptomyces caelestis TaxID=36816 RepID=A0A0M9X679_9ACTN|nr:hypothetical protein ADK41_32450 [Streptomyces caelestis]